MTDPTGSRFTDEIFVEGLRCDGYHGVNPEERALGQRFIVDLSATVDAREAGASDDLTATVSYSALAKLARCLTEGAPHNLLERLGELIARETLSTFPAVSAVIVTIRKPAAPIKGAILDAAGVTIRRRRDEMTG